ncbi:MAG: B3/4 domain-containing protein [Francisellaceae bacterium]
MKFTICKHLLKDYPNMSIGLVIARFSDKLNLEFVNNSVTKITKTAQEKMPDGTISSNSSLALWKKIYANFTTRSKNIEASVIALSRRAKNNKFPRINPIVDTYNLSSIITSTPIGGYDLDNISGNITIQYSGESRAFNGIGMSQTIHTDPADIIYKDDQNTLCWLWNYRDSQQTLINESTKHAIFFLDCVDSNALLETNLQSAQERLIDSLQNLGGKVMSQNILNAESPGIELDVTEHTQKIENLLQ